MMKRELRPLCALHVCYCIKSIARLVHGGEASAHFGEKVE